jgi:hypothetical protein
VNQAHISLCFLLLAWIVPTLGIADDRTSKTNHLTTIEAVTIDGAIFVSIKTERTKVVARSLTLEGTLGPLTITATPQGLEMKNGRMTLTTVRKLELQTNLKVTKLDLISLEISPEEK